MPITPSPTLNRLALSLGYLVMGGAGATAAEPFIIGPRALGMGGANVACVNDVQAQFYNPAAFGFFAYSPDGGAKKPLPPVKGQEPGKAPAPERGGVEDNNNLWDKDFGFAVDAEVGVRIHHQFTVYVDQLKQINDSGVFDRLSNTGVVNETDATNLVKFANSLGNIANRGNGVSLDGNAGVSCRIQHLGFGLRTYFEASGWVQQLDLTHLGLGGGVSLNTAMTAVGVTNNDGQVLLLTPAQQAQLGPGPGGAGLSLANVQKIDFLAREAGVTPGQAQQLSDILAQVAVAPPSGNFNQNTTSVRLYGFGLAEIPVTYGYAIDRNWSVGASAKFMIGRVYGTDVLVFQNDASSSVKNITDNFKQSANLGLDVGVMWRQRMFQAGLVGRNLNAPTFHGPTVNGVTYDDYRLSPQVTTGGAFIPFETLSFETDLDLTKSATTMPDYRTQFARAGVEWNLLHFLALRGGFYRNLAQNDIGWVLTGGFGINFWLMRIDLAAAAATRRDTFDGKKIPREDRVALQVAVDF